MSARDPARGRGADRDDDLLGPLGIAPSEERAYRALLRDGSADLTELSRRTGMPTAALRPVVARLEREGMVSRLPGRRLRLVATSPHVAIGAVAARREEEIARVRGLAAVLAEETGPSAGGSPENLLEIVTGRDAVGHSFQQLNLAARREVRALVRPPFAADVSLEPVTQDAALNRGIRARSVYDVSALDTVGLLDAARHLVDGGEEARVGEVPIKLVIVDSEIALLPVSSGDRDAAQSAVVVHRSTLLDALIALFEAIWRVSSPLRLVGPATGADQALTDDDAELIGLLSAGLKDETIARQLGVSLRTLQRRLSELFDGLGARTRFQAGYLVGRTNPPPQ